MSIASMMMEEMLEMIKETPLQILDLEVRSDNQNAIQLYKKFHFHLSEVHIHIYALHSRPRYMPDTETSFLLWRP